MILWCHIVRILANRSVYECVCEFNRKLCSFCCRQVKKEMRRNGLDWIVSYRRNRQKKPFSDTKRPKTRIIAVFAVFFSLYQNVNIWRTWRLLNDPSIHIFIYKCVCCVWKTSSLVNIHTEKMKRSENKKNEKIKLSEHVCLFYACLWVCLKTHHKTT